jgi:hypothetical protein
VRRFTRTAVAWESSPRLEYDASDQLRQRDKLRSPRQADQQTVHSRRGFKMTMLAVNSQTTLVKDRARPSAGRFCVLVTSSDQGRDVFEIVFQNADTIWHDCDWPRFVGFTSKHPDPGKARSSGGKQWAITSALFPSKLKTYCG